MDDGIDSQKLRGGYFKSKIEELFLKKLYQILGEEDFLKFKLYLMIVLTHLL